MLHFTRQIKTLSALLLVAAASACTSPSPLENHQTAHGQRRVPELSPPSQMQFESAGKAAASALVPTARAEEIMRQRMVALAPTSTAKYQQFTENTWTRVAEQPVSTISAQVDTGSYANVRRFLDRGHLPPKDAVRVEELVNYFDYAYAQPANGDEPLRAEATVVRSPWAAERNLLRISLKGKDLAQAQLPPANLVFLVDVSGSMGYADRLPLVKSALNLLVNQLRPVDRVTIVTYASGTRLALPPTAGDRKEAIRNAIDRLQAGGATYGEAGIRMAYSQARQTFIAGGINRVLLATDGDLNVGATSTAELKALVEAERERGVGLTTLGVGDTNYNEALMKQLADAGNGSYHYLDSLQEADKVLVHEFTSTLAVIAQDVKLQVEFNPATVDEYRLIGYELSALRREEFTNDRVDAGDVGAGHAVTALYEFVPHGQKGSVDPLRYTDRQRHPAPSAAMQHDGEFAWVKLRFKTPGAGESRLIENSVKKTTDTQTVDSADDDLRFAVAVAGWGQWLRRSALIGSWNAENSLRLARSGRGEDTLGQRAEFQRLVQLSAQVRQ